MTLSCKKKEGKKERKSLLVMDSVRPMLHTPALKFCLSSHHSVFQQSLITWQCESTISFAWVPTHTTLILPLCLWTHCSSRLECTLLSLVQMIDRTHTFCILHNTCQIRCSLSHLFLLMERATQRTTRDEQSHGSGIRGNVICNMLEGTQNTADTPDKGFHFVCLFSSVSTICKNNCKNNYKIVC